MARWFHFVPTLLLFSNMLAICLSVLRLIGYELRVAGYGVDRIAVIYLFIVVFAFLIPSFWLAKTRKTASYYIYLRLFITWFIGWGLGFLEGLFLGRKNREVVAKATKKKIQYK